MEQRQKKTHRDRAQAAGQLVGKIVSAYVSAELNDFAVILQETPKTVVLAHLATEQISGRPLLQDGQAAANALIKVFRAPVSRILDTYPSLPTTPLLALLRLDKKFFTHRVQVKDARPGEVLVEVIRVTKCLSPGSALGSVSFPSKRYHCCYYLCDLH
ncbi:MAG TPA: hypothetical protein PK867_01515 [Pirellulales bacterium]|nr:hypothetical protein [Pirellulales bacterium]